MSYDLSDIRIQTNKSPLYIAVKAKIRELVENGTFTPGSKLPSETELASKFNVSRNTLREALRLAQREGWVVQKHGVGTFISRGGLVEQGLEALESIDSLAEREGWDCYTKDVVIETVPASDVVAAGLHCDPGTPVVRVTRIKTRDIQPIAYFEDYFAADLVDLDTFRENFTGSVLDFFIARGTPPIDYAWTDITSLHAGQRFSDMLDIPKDEILMLAEETVYSEDGTPFHYSHNYMVMKFFTFHIVRTVPDQR